MSALDPELWVAAAGGCRTAFEKLLDGLLPQVRRLLHRLGGFSGEIDDLTQEVFVRVIDGLPRLRNPEQGRSWVYGIAVNVTREATRHRTREAHLETLGATARPHETGTAIETTETRKEVQAAIRDLPPGLREVLVLSAFEQMTPGEIAATLGLSPEAVRHRLFRARKILREKLAPSPAAPGRSGEGPGPSMEGDHES